MQINLGERIKELRKRDCRTQEALATAVGVTNQAVSRWESGGAYPDVELIPAIAHYFHVSIDELFGYSEEREETIQKILNEADKSICARGDQTACIEMLRAAAEEFPSDGKILYFLGMALELQGWGKIGARSTTSDDSDYVHEDTEYNAQNEYWQEAVKVYEKALGMNLNDEDREIVLMSLIILCAKIGKSEKAKELANKQNTIYLSRELLLTYTSEAEEKDKYSGLALIELLRNIQIVVTNTVLNKIPLMKSDTGIEIFTALAHFYEYIFSDGKFGIIHTCMFDLYNMAAIGEARLHPDSPKAIEYFTRAFEHKKTYDKIRCAGEYHYGAPLVSKAVWYVDFPVFFGEGFWQSWLSVYPENLKNAIAQNPEFAEVFEE